MVHVATFYVSTEAGGAFATHFIATKYYMLLVYCEKWLGCRHTNIQDSCGESLEKECGLSGYLIFWYSKLV
jgi:hypothetical protein